MRQPKGPFAGLRFENPLFVFGVAASVHDDPEVAREVEACLQPCWGQADNLTDRFDARLLLDEAAAAPAVPHRQAASREPQAALEPGVTQEQLEYERYRDMDYSREHELQLHGRAMSAPGGPEGSLERSDGEDAEEDNESYEGALPPPPGFAAIPFSYGTDDRDETDGAPGSAQQQPPQQRHRHQGDARGAKGGNGSGYHTVGFSYDAPADGPAAAEAREGGPPRPASQQGAALPVPGSGEPAFVPRFLVPEHLRRGLPATERHFKVIQQTASFVREGGGQLEVLLRVKQAGNPLFSFLLPADPLHAFYRWLVETRPEERVVINAAPAAEGEGQAAAQQAGQLRQAEQQQQGEQHHPSEQWRVGPAEQPPPWQVNRHAAPAEMPAAQRTPPVEFGPTRRPSAKARESLSQLAQYDDDWSSQGSAADGIAGAKVPPDPAAELISAAPAPAEAGSGGDQQEVGAVSMPPKGAEVADEAAGDTNTVPAAGNGLPASEAAAAAGAAAAGAAAAGAGTPPASKAAGDHQPPQDMLAVMQKLVAFIKMNGSRFEGMVRAKEAANPIFSFLEPTSKYHQHYRDLLAEAIGDAETNAILPASAAPKEQAPEATHGPAAVLQKPPPVAPVEAPAVAVAEHVQGTQAVAAAAAGAEPPPWARPASPGAAAAAPPVASAVEGGTQLQIQGQKQGQETARSVPSEEPPALTPPEAAGSTVTAALTAQPAVVVVSAAPALLATAAGAAGGALAGAVVTTTLGPITLPSWLKEKMVAAAAGAASGGSTATTTTTPSVKLQANPSITKLATVKQSVGSAAGAAAGRASGNPGAEAAAAEAASPAASSPALSSESGHAAGAEADEGAGAEGPARSRSGPGLDGEDAQLAEEEERKKAERRRRARELMLQRQQQAALAAARQRQQQLSAISVHRAAFLAADEEPFQLEVEPVMAGGGAVRAGRSAAQRPLPPRPGRDGAAAAKPGPVEDVEEGEILPAAAEAPAMGLEAARPGAGSPGNGHISSRSRPQSRGAEARAPARLPLLEDLVSQRMHRAGSGDALASPVAAAEPGQAQAPQQHPQVTIAGHRAAFGSEAGVPRAGRSRLSTAGAQQQHQEQQGKAAAGVEPALGDEASLHLRRIRDRIAAMTGSASKAAGSEGAARAGPSSREGSGLSGRPLAPPPLAPSLGTKAASSEGEGEPSGRVTSGPPSRRSRKRSPSSESSTGSGTSSDDSRSRRRSRPTSRAKSRSPSSHKRHKQRHHGSHGSRERKRHRRRHRSKSGGRGPAADGEEERGHTRRHSHRDTRTRRLHS